MADTVKKANTPKLVRAYARDLRIAPRKLRLVSNMVRGMRVSEALTHLDFTNKKGAPMVSKLLKSAVANAENNFSLNSDALFIKSITTDMGRVMKRYFPRARGSAFVIQRKMAHLNVVLEEKPGMSKSKYKVAKKEKTSEDQDKKVQEKLPETREASKSVKPETHKSSESIKANQVQQKRRLFNRKSGE